MTLLIDADYIVYKCTAAAEEDYDFGEDVIFVTSNFSDAMRLVYRDLDNITSNFNGGFDDVILFFSSSKNFRKDIDPNYKGNRNRKKPCGYRRVIDRLTKEFCVVLEDKLEADDAIGVFATANPGNIIVSPDKDLRQIPGDIWNLKDAAVDHILPDEGEKWFYMQAMAGDMTDGYSGVPGIGLKRAEALLDKHGCCWKTVLDTYLDKGLTEEDALLNARLARILTNDLYKDGEIKLWNPPDAHNRADTGAAIPVEANS